MRLAQNGRTGPFVYPSPGLGARDGTVTQSRCPGTENVPVSFQPPAHWNSGELPTWRSGGPSSGVFDEITPLRSPPILLRLKKGVRDLAAWAVGELRCPGQSIQGPRNLSVLGERRGGRLLSPG